MVDTFNRLGAAAAGAPKRLPSLRIYLGITIALLAVVAILFLQDAAVHGRDAAQRRAGEIRDRHDRSKTEQLIDELVSTAIYNQPRTALNETFPLTMRVVANPALPIVTNCRTPQRLQFKARVLAPNFEVENALDDAVALPAGVQRFSWMLTPRESGLQEARVRGIVYCLSTQGVVTMRQTVVDELRAVAVAQPLAFSAENWTNLGIALCGLIGSSGVLASIAGLLRHHEKSGAANA